MITVRARRQFSVLVGRIKPPLKKAIPFVVAFWFGSQWGAELAETRIHADCKYTNSFRIGYQGYQCHIGRM